VFIANFLGAGHVQECLGVAIKLRQLRLVQPKAATAFVVPAEAPAITEPVLFQGGHNHVEIADDIR
jgi:hypothetical protein